MQILKHKFEVENIGIKDGEIVALDPTVIECNFSLTIKALELFEEEYGKPVINALFGKDRDETTSSAFVKALACSSYFVIEGNQIIQNQATKESFKNLEIYNTLGSDLSFTTEIVSMALKCVEETTKKNVENNKPPKN